MSMSTVKTAEHEVARYYNKNTFRFLRFVPDKSAGTIHRRLYPKGKNRKTDPSHTSDDLVLNLIRETEARRILDLGCGVGGSINYLRSRNEGDFTGITLSPVQYKIALEQDIPVELGSYLDSSWYRDKEAFDLIFAIESLQHNPDHKLLIRNLLQVMKKGSRLLIIDDFLIDGKTLGRKEEALVSQFKKHWHAYGYTSVHEIVKILEDHGFILSENTDMTSLMKKPFLNRTLRGGLLRILSWLPLQSSALDNIIGGGTLLLLQQLRLSGYNKLVFRYEGVYP